MTFPLPTFWLALALGVPGLVIATSRSQETLYLIAPIAMVLATVLIFYTSSRFRLPAVPFLLIGSGVYIASIIDWLKAGNNLKAANAGFVALFIATASIGVATPPESGNEEHLLAKSYWKLNNLDAAKEMASNAANEYPKQARFQTLLAMVALSAGDYSESIRLNEKAIGLEKHHADAWHNMGLGYLGLGRPEEAASFFRKAFGFNGRPLSLYLCAKSLSDAGKIGQAVSTYKSVLEITPPGSPLWHKTKGAIASSKTK
jgi:tetratricopeptide (TPR) repeat protein